MDRRGFSLAAVASAVAVCAGMAGCTASGSQSSRAQQLPGLSALVPSGAVVEYSAVTAVSCAGPGDCVVGGTLTYATNPRSGLPLRFVSFVAEERGGTWRPARALGGLGAQAASSQGGIQSLSCSSPGACVAAGEYGTATTHGAFIVTERGGVWGTPVPVPGLTRLSVNAWVQVGGLACWGAGNCVLAGSYGPADIAPYGPLGPYGGHVFWASEASGTWGPAVPLPDPPSPATGAYATAACDHGGTCAIAATYTHGAPAESHNVLTTVTGGKLGTVTPAGQGGTAIDAVSCPPAGGCVAVGIVEGRPTRVMAFTLHGGTWSAAVVPGLKWSAGLSCTGPGTCTVGGGSSTAGNPAAVASEVGGTWRPAVALPGAASLRDAGPMLMSCADPRDCVAGGYADSAAIDVSGFPGTRPFIAVENAGAWSAAQDVPGIAGLDGGRDASLTAIACPAPGAWTGGGDYDTGQPPGLEQYQAPGNNLAPFVIASAP